MAYDLEEQESLAEIKAWWDKWGTLILSVVTAVCLAVAAMQGWRWYQAKESADAGTLYAQMIQAVNAKDNGRAQAIMEASSYGLRLHGLCRNGRTSCCPLRRRSRQERGSR